MLTNVLMIDERGWRDFFDSQIYHRGHLGSTIVDVSSLPLRQSRVVKTRYGLSSESRATFNCTASQKLHPESLNHRQEAKGVLAQKPAPYSTTEEDRALDEGFGEFWQM